MLVSVVMRATFYWARGALLVAQGLPRHASDTTLEEHTANIRESGWLSSLTSQTKTHPRHAQPHTFTSVGQHIRARIASQGQTIGFNRGGGIDAGAAKRRRQRLQLAGARRSPRAEGRCIACFRTHTHSSGVASVVHGQSPLLEAATSAVQRLGI
jgi:hypothetical protein